MFRNVPGCSMFLVLSTAKNVYFISEVSCNESFKVNRSDLLHLPINLTNFDFVSRVDYIVYFVISRSS